MREVAQIRFIWNLISPYSLRPVDKMYVYICCMQS